MEGLDGELRDRVRAAALWLVAGLTVLGVLLGLWAIHVGFLRTSITPSTVLEVSDDGRTITLEVSHGACERPAGVEVSEDEYSVVLTAYVTERTPLRGSACTDVAVVERATVVLDDPVGERELRTTSP